MPDRFPVFIRFTTASETCSATPITVAYGTTNGVSLNSPSVHTCDLEPFPILNDRAAIAAVACVLRHERALGRGELLVWVCGRFLQTPMREECPFCTTKLPALSPIRFPIICFRCCQLVPFYKMAPLLPNSNVHSGFSFRVGFEIPFLTLVS
jgi:hypothetical protein